MKYALSMDQAVLIKHYFHEKKASQSYHYIIQMPAPAIYVIFNRTFYSKS